MSQAIRNLLPSAALRLKRELAAQADDLAQGLITRDVALELGTSALATSHANAAFAGRALAGATAPLGELDRTVGRMIAEEQAQYYERFLKDVQAGRYLDDEGEVRSALIEARAGSYTERLRGTANESWVNTLDVDELIFWKLGGDEGASCSICPDLADQGPYKASELPSIPGNNETPCLYNCRCYLETESGGDAGFKYFGDLLDHKTLPLFGLGCGCIHKHL